MPFIMITVLIDMMSIGLIVPVLPALVGSFTASQTEQAWWYGAVTLAFSHRQLLRLADARRALGSLRPPAGAADRLLRPGAQLLRHRAGDGALDADRRAAARAARCRRTRSVANAYVADITPPEDRAQALRPARRDVRHRLHPRPGDGRPARRDRPAPAVLRRRLAGAAQPALRLVRAAGIAAAPTSAGRSPGARRSTRSPRSPSSAGSAASASWSRWSPAPRLSQFVLYTSWVLYTTFKFGWGPQENGWSLFTVGCMSALVQGVLLGRLLKRFSPQRLAIVGLVSSTLAYLGWGAATEGWMMYAVILVQRPRLHRRGVDPEHHLRRRRRDDARPHDGRGELAAEPDGGGRAGAQRAAARRRLAPAARRLAHRRAVLLLRRWSSSRRSCWPGCHFSAAASRPRRRRHARAPPDMHDKILILDFGSQVTQLIARRVREAHVFCEIHPNDVSDAFVREFAPEGHHPVRQPRLDLRGARAARAEGGVRARRAGARHLLRHVHDGGAARRRGRGEHAPRVRLRRGARARPHAAARGDRGLRDDRRPRHAQGLDEPRRQGHGAAARLHADGVDAELPDRRHGRRGARLLRRPVPSRGHAHAARARELLEPLRARDLRRQARLGDGQLHRRGGRADPRAGRRRRGHPRPVGRRRLERRRGADPQGDRRPADLRLRRPRPAAPRRRPAGHGHVRRAPPHEGDRTSTPASASSASSPASPTRGQAQDHRQRVRRRLHARGGEAEAGEVAGAGDDLSRRDRVGRRQDQEGDRRSRATTTSAACRRRSA